MVDDIKLHRINFFTNFSIVDIDTKGMVDQFFIL